jgi:hypothetical protein
MAGVVEWRFEEMIVLTWVFAGMFTGRALDAGFYYYSVVPGMLLAALGMCMYPLSR